LVLTPWMQVFDLGVKPTLPGAKADLEHGPQDCYPTTQQQDTSLTACLPVTRLRFMTGPIATKLLATTDS
jgi:hypothetical protein